MKETVTEDDIIKNGFLHLIKMTQGGEGEASRKSSNDEDALDEAVQNAIEKYMGDYVQKEIKKEAQKMMKKEGVEFFRIVQEHVRTHVPVDMVSRLAALEEKDLR